MVICAPIKDCYISLFNVFSLDDNDPGFEDMLQEVDILKRLGSSNHVTQMFAYNTIQEPYFILLEYAQNGDLRKYLIDKRENVSHYYQ